MITMGILLLPGGARPVVQGTEKGKKAEKNLAALVRPFPGEDAAQLKAKVEEGEMEGVGARIRLTGTQLDGSRSANI